jgi:hypothetical protein
MIKGAASQTGNLTEWQDSNSNVIALINTSAEFRGAGLVNLISYQNSRFLPDNAGAIINTNIVGNVGLRVQNTNASATADLQQWQNSSGTVLSRISANGSMLVGANASPTGYLHVTNTDNSIPNLVIERTVDGGTSNILEVKNGSSTRFYLSALGFLNSASGTFNNGAANIYTPLTVVNTLSTTIASVIKGASSQSADLTQWQNSGATVIAKIDSSGNMTAAKFVTTGGTSAQYVMGDGSLTSSSNIPQNSQTSAYTAVATDSGKQIAITTGGVTIPASVFSVGDNFMIFNNSSSSQTITQGSGVTLRLSGTASFGNRTLSQYGLASVMCVASNVFLISGAGLA